MSTINSVQIYRADLPLGRRLEHASASEAVLEEVFLRIETQDDGWGLAEIRGNGAYATGTDTRSVLTEFANGLGTALLGLELPEAEEKIPQLTQVPLVQALADGAVLDAQARAKGIPLFRFLGGESDRPLATHAQIGFCPPAAAARQAHEAARSGFSRLKVRVGRPDPTDDIAVIAAVREASGSDMAIAIDANGGWDLETAIRTLSLLREYRIAWVEQPTPPSDDADLRHVREATDTPVIGDESVRSAEDIQRLVKAKAIDGVHLKLEKAGTARHLKHIANVAREVGLFVCIGQMDQGRLGSSLTAHLCASIPADAYEIWGFQNVLSDVSEGLEPHAGRIALPDGPGTGVNVDLGGLALVDSYQ